MSSSADAAFEVLQRVVRESRLFHYSDPALTESDIRSKLIDPLFKEVLGWSESDITREEPAADGFADYRFGAEYPYFHIEAKRAAPRFVLNATSKPRVLKVSGPHLLGNKDVRRLLEQTAKYTFDLGTEFAILSNGTQLILFKTRLTGASWKTGHAYVWHDHDDMLADFARLYDILSKERVQKGSLFALFDDVEGVTQELFSPISFLRNPDLEFVRNHFWSQIASVFGPLLSVQPDDVSLQQEIVAHCYVKTPLSDEANSSIDALLKDQLPDYLKKTNLSDLTLGQPADKMFQGLVLNDIKSFKARTYILTGGVGSGKTTFLRRFAYIINPMFIQKFCLWLHVDFLPIGSVPEHALEETIAKYTFRKLRDLLASEYPACVPGSGEELRSLFSKEIEDLSQTKLFGVEPDSEEWRRTVNELVHSLVASDQDFVEAILNKALSRRSIVFVLDNTDQLGELFQEKVFLLAQKLSNDFRALSIVALREEKYFAAYRRGIFDAYGDRRFHIGSPNLGDVVRRRLEYGLDKLTHALRDGVIESGQQEDIELLIRTFIRSTTVRNANIVRMLSCVSNGDMRYALDMFKDFVSSGNTYIDKILATVRATRGYTVPFHEFAKSVILGSRRFHRNSVSRVVNLFVKSNARNPSHLTACRIILRLTSAQSSPSSHGVGFVDSGQVIREYRESFGMADDFIAVMNELLSRGLVESEPPRVNEMGKTEAVRISASGAYYWQFLVRSFAYVDLMLTDTPLADRDLAKSISDMLELTDLSVRFERVRMFLDYLGDEEAKEQLSSEMRGGPYRQAIIPGVRVECPRFSSRGYESRGWVTGTGSLCCWREGVARPEAAQRRANCDGVCPSSELCGRYSL